MSETEGQRAFAFALLNVISGRCVCGRPFNKQGRTCCRKCADGLTGHSKQCERNNPRG